MTNLYNCRNLPLKANLKIFRSPDCEPVDDLNPGDEAETEEEAEEAANLGDEVNGGHPEGALELEYGRLLRYRLDRIRLLVIKNMDYHNDSQF